MKGAERGWVSLLNSSRMRALRGSAPVQRLLGSKMADRLDLYRRRWLARRAARRDPALLDHLGTICLFVGHVKSGGSLLGAMIDAHTDAVLADEVDVLDHLDQGFSRDQLLRILVRNARREALKGRVTARRLGGYSLAIPDLWQGRHRVVRVIGESRAGPTTRRLGDDSDHLERLRRFAHPAELRFIHVVRNPLDPIGAMVRRGGRSVEEACRDYAAQVARLERIRSWLEDGEILTVHYEELVESPESTLSRVIGFLGLDTTVAYLSACSDLVDPGRPGERRYVDWSPADLERVRGMVDSCAFLGRYREGIELEARSVGS